LILEDPYHRVLSLKKKKLSKNKGNYQRRTKWGKPDENGGSAPIEKGIFWPGIISVLAVVLFMILFEDQSKKVISAIFNFCTNQLGFIYIWFGAIALGIVAWLGLGKYSKVRLGGPDAKPEFSRWSWIAMFFCSGIGTS